ncbi:MAG: alpha/beta fold hydrolase [Actinomycetes bacterium]|jgi:pimeloyl-ACP methyl ester carboxylesterase
MSRRPRRLLRPLVRRLLPGAPVGGGAAAAGREVLVAGADGQPIPVTEQGRGPAVLLLHAGSADRSSWAGVAAALAGRFRVVRVEPLGGEALRRARAALDAGDPDRAITIHMREIVGAGRLAVAAMRRVPPIWQVVRGHAPAQITDDEAIESLGVGLDRYARLCLPVLLLGGGRSPAHLRERLDALAAVLPRLDSVVVLDGQGHLATLRAPGEVARVIAAFADRLAL